MAKVFFTERPPAPFLSHRNQGNQELPWSPVVGVEQCQGLIHLLVAVSRGHTY